MPEFFSCDQPEEVTVHFSPVHLAWLRETAAQGNIDVSTVLFWVVDSARRAKEQPWPPGAQGWQPWSKEKK